MGTGIVFVYLLIAACVAPLLWLFWWGADSLAGGTRFAVPATVPPRRHTRRTYEPVPHAVDLNLRSTKDGVTIYSLAGREIGSCKGPDTAGRCPRVDAAGPVPCSGCVLALPLAIRGSFEWEIPSAYGTCLLGSYAAFRRSN